MMSPACNPQIVDPNVLLAFLTIETLQTLPVKGTYLD